MKQSQGADLLLHIWHSHTLIQQRTKSLICTITIHILICHNMTYEDSMYLFIYYDTNRWEHIDLVQEAHIQYA